jgi:hypothetical protein
VPMKPREAVDTALLLSKYSPDYWTVCNIWGFHGRDYEECRLLGYKTPVRSSQELHCFSTTERSRLMLCKIWGFHGSDSEECRLLGYKTPVIYYILLCIQNLWFEIV